MLYYYFIIDNKFRPQFERNLYDLATKIQKIVTPTATLSNEEVSHLFKGTMPLGGAIEEYEINYTKPSILKIDYTDASSVAEALKQVVNLPTHLPTSYSYTGPVYENYISFAEDELQNACNSLGQFLSIGAKKAQRFAEVIRSTQAFIAKQLITMSLETLLKYKEAEFFDVTKNYDQTKRIDLKENNVNSEKLSYQTFKDTKEVTTETRFGVCFQPIKANEFASFDAAVKALEK